MRCVFFLVLVSTLSAQTPPPQAAGYSLAYSDDFNTLDLSTDGTGNHFWYDGVWFYHNPAPLSDISAAGSALSLVWQQGQGPDDTSIETFAQNNSNYRAWRYGYFEARMKWDVTTGAWPAFWLTPVETALGLDFYNGVQEQGEFDIFEGQGDEPHTFFGTIHDWKNGVGTANSNNTWPLGQSVDFSQYHTYGMLWTPGQVTWYFDNQPLMSAPTPAVVDQQHYLMILAMQEGAGWQYGNLSGVTASSMALTVDWVRVWQLPSETEPLQFVPITPCRVADTRLTNGPFGGPELSAMSQRDFSITGSSCGVPSSAAAVAVNVTVAPDSWLGYLTIWPSGQATPVVSTINSDGRTKANAAIVTAGTNGNISVYVSNSTNVVLDVDGYFVPSGLASALAFYPLTPCRVADTRLAAGTFGGPYLAKQSSRNFPVLASACNVPSNAQAYSLNLTAVPRMPLGYLTAYPSGQATPVASNLNAFTGTVTANAAIVRAGTNGGVSVFTSDDTDLVMDINGYFATPGSGGLSLYPLQPCRLLDTRTLPGAPMVNGMQSVNVSGGSCNVPATAQAYVLNATVAPTGYVGYLSLWPDGDAKTIASTLNADTATVTSNMAIVPTLNGSIDVFSSNATALILDLSSYFAP